MDISPPPLRIALVCASLEPGRDGVGDYCRRLAGALTRSGATASLLAIADRHVSEPLAPSAHELRLPAAMVPAGRHRLAARALARWSPDWCSLQFVCWSHGWRGVVTGEATRLRRLFAGRDLHMMFHEPWLTGEFEVEPSPSRRLARHALGLAQKLAMARLARGLRPAVAHTSNAVYRRMLREIGVTAGLLPLFGNIAPGEPMDWTDLRALARAKAGIELPTTRTDVLLAGVFGAIRGVPVRAALHALVGAAGGRSVALLSLGAAGAHAGEALSAWARDVPGLRSGMLGVLDADQLSACFGQLDIAISLHPAQVVGRSGAVAALLEHGVPVVSAWGVPPPAEDTFAQRWRPLLLPADERLGAALRGLPPRDRRSDTADAAARLLLAELRHAGRRTPDLAGAA